jgi:UDP-glucose 4-epimerase
VVDVAEVLIAGRDIPIVYTGIRPGEKIHEIMVSEEECHRTVERQGYYVICPMLPEVRQQSIDRPARDVEYSSAEVTLDRAQLAEMLEPYTRGATE